MTEKPDTCKTCPGYLWPSRGFAAAPTGNGTNGVLLVHDALDEAGSVAGAPLAGRAGHHLETVLQRLGLKRTDFLIDTCVRCRPLDDKLHNTSYEMGALEHCAVHLDTTITTRTPKAIVAMGPVAVQRLLDTHTDEKVSGLRGYPIWSPKYQVWIIPTYSPTYVMKGHQALTGVFLSDVQKAVRIARDGFTQRVAPLLVDPTPPVMLEWVEAFEACLRLQPQTRLAYDIETPMKLADSEIDVLEDDPSYEILRISFAYKDSNAVSIPWSAEYYPLIKRLLESPAAKILWNAGYDRPRVVYNGITPNGDEWDAMIAWHVLQSDLPKKLDYVAPLLLHDQLRWKHLSKDEPGLYSAMDADVTWRLMGAIEHELKLANLWSVFDEHVIQLDRVLTKMSRAGVPVSQERIQVAREQLTASKEAVNARMQAAVPDSCKKVTVRKTFKEGWEPIDVLAPVKQCSVCGALGVTKTGHTAKKKDNLCWRAPLVTVQGTVTNWIQREPFVPSKAQMTTYLVAHKHRAVSAKVKKGEDPSITFNEGAIKDLMKWYPSDPLYPLILTYRETEKLLSTYVDGLVLGKDGKVHTQYVHNPSTLRLASKTPNMQNIPRNSGDGPSTWIKSFFIAEPGTVLWEADFKAIEAQLVGYLANDRDYIRLAKLGVHDFLNSHILLRAGKIGQSADLSWSDADLKLFFKDLKKRFNTERDVAKRVVHMSNYLGTPNRMVDANPETFPTVKFAREMQDLYFEVCPGVKRWQQHTVALAAKQAYIRNPFGYLHRFWNVLNWKKERDGEWHSTFGDDAKRAVAFGPQSTAAGIIKDAMLEIAAQGLDHYLRLQVHDSLVAMLPIGEVDELSLRLSSIMSAPCKKLPLDPTWGMGPYLSIEVEVKMGPSWGEAKEV